MALTGRAEADVSAAASPRDVADHRGFVAARLGAYLAGVLILALAVNVLARSERYRWRIDATKTRAYSLSEQTRRMLDGLQGQWTIATVMSSKYADRAVRRQIDEVLGRFTAASPRIHAVQIDPDDAQSFAAFDGLVARLRAVYARDIEQYDRALDAGVAAFGELQVFAQQQSAVLEQVVARLPADDPTREPLTQGLGVIGLFAEQGDVLLKDVHKARRLDAGRPLADFETARSILVEALRRGSNELETLAGVFKAWLERRDADQSVRQFATAARGDYQALAQQLAIVADDLRRLPGNELSAIGRELAQREAAVVIGPDRAAIIPSWQLVPKNVQRGDENAVTFDQRFRGEQIIAATLRSLTVPHMPLVVFVHGEDGSLLRPRDRDADLIGAAAVLKSARYQITEWPVATQAQRPVPLGDQGSHARSSAAGVASQPVVWVIVPPPQRQGLAPSKGERALIDAARTLIDEGQPVLLSMYPSFLSRAGQTDEWSQLAAPFGLHVDTSRIFCESMRTGEATRQVQRGRLVQELDSDHLIARAVNGQQAYFSLAMPIEVEVDESLKGTPAAAAAPSGARIVPIASVAPAPNRWLEKEWSADPASLAGSDEHERFQKPLPFIVAAERLSKAGPAPSRVQRLVLVASGGWMLRYAADSVISLGGDRRALEYPGNHELMLASVAWLAGMDDVIAASPMSQEVARLRGISRAELTIWRWLLAAVLPAACLALGVIVHVMRRS